MIASDCYRGCLLGLACGDAVGTTVEFRPRGSFAPLTDVVGGGPFGLAPGQWTDDTSMALCLAESLIEKGGFDARDQMERYCRWWRTGYLSSTGACFDIGGATRRALERFEKTGEPYSGSANPDSAGNGSIMRLAPIPMFFSPDEKAVIHFSAESSRTTHAARECLDACRLLGLMICRALSGASKEEILSAGKQWSWQEPLSAKIGAIADGQYRQRSETKIKGSGYVVESLEAALWCFDRSNDFKEAILKAANLGDDADTTSAVCGQIAGAFYGEAGIPEGWLKRLAMRERIGAWAEALHRQRAPANSAIGLRSGAAGSDRKYPT